MLIGMAIMPHGNEAVYPPDEETRKLHENLKEIGEELRGAETYVLITPHNVRISWALGVIMAEHLIPWLPFNDVDVPVEEEYGTDRELAQEIFLGAKAEFPIVDINFATSGGKYSRFPLTWGEIIPLYFLEKRPLILITPAKLERERLIEFGRFLGNLLEKADKKVAVVVSADHGHAHSEEGPYGYAEESEEYDKRIVEMLKSGNLEGLLEFTDEFIAKAKPDSYWSLLIALGILREIPMKPDLVSYACPTYYGMASALFRR
ncbi:DODA-type extradiol aromatic ring-opening family dioxygenase [Pyrococcus kukulkanii]|uniref:Dioxygenase n=1 Tax=Pyrococcus kukulkanii TaxID=1609559 RepID=A0A127B8K1_9EURY|nr:extradiol dioxygenase [Pyrococcus kukulkanii]AMM53604.1 dioxygenase [Pyrococcus kukulkanii]